MKIHRLLSVLLPAALWLTAPVLSQAADQQAGKLDPITASDAAWAAEARKHYPLDACVVSDEKLGSMGDATEYIYRVKGQPDRLVKFCCDGCIEDFLSEPETYLAKVAAKKTDQPAAKAHSHH